jgi:ABC-type uncharacterized transport system substrate-binding protein
MKYKNKIIAIVMTIILTGTVISSSFYFNLWGKGGSGQIHFSIDDVISVCEDITVTNRESIIDNEMLGFFKECHDMYGAKFSLYCYYESEDFNLGMVLDKYKEEFMENADWLMFGFHYKDGKEPTEISAEEIIRDYNQLTSELIRITGSTCTTVRLSYFKGSYEVCSALKEQGIQCLLTADDDRLSYYFDEDTNLYINKNDSWYDDSNGLNFVSTDLRLDNRNSAEVYYKLIEISEDEAQNKIIAVFAHEWLMGRKMYSSIKAMCQFAKYYDYEWTMLE